MDQHRPHQDYKMRMRISIRGTGYAEIGRKYEVAIFRCDPEDIREGPWMIVNLDPLYPDEDTEESGKYILLQESHISYLEADSLSGDLFHLVITRKLKIRS